MAGYIFKKTSRGKTYYYAGQSQRDGKKVGRKWEVYLGSFDKIVKTMGEGVLLPDNVSSTPFGLYAAFVELAKRIDFVEIIDAVFPKRDQGLTIGEYVLFGILARLTKPIAKRSIQEWYVSKRIEKVYPVDPVFLTVQNYWNNMVSLDLDRVNEVHHRFIERIGKDHSLDRSFIYFDPSNFHTFINTEGETATIAQNGNSKKKRFDLRQVNLALAVTRKDGFPVYHKTYQGNVNDVTFFKEHVTDVVDQLRKSTSGELVIVFDKGNNAKDVFDVLAGLKESHVEFIGSLRPSTQKELFSTPVDLLPDHFVTDSGTIVRYLELDSVKVYGRSYHGALTFDERTYRKKLHTWMTNMNKITDEIQEFIDTRLNVKKWRRKEAVEEKLKKITNQKGMKNVIHCQVHGSYGQLHVSMYCDMKSAYEKMSHAGKNLIITSIDNEDIVEIIKGYRMKNDIEDCFKILNNPYLLSVQPFHHWTDQMITAHMATCIFGLQIIQLMRKMVRDAGMNISIGKIFEQLHDITLVRLHYNNRKTVYKIGSIKRETRRLIEELNVKMNVET